MQNASFTLLIMVLVIVAAIDRYDKTRQLILTLSMILIITLTVTVTMLIMTLLGFGPIL